MKHTLITLIAFTFMFSCYQGPTVEFDDEKSQAVAAILFLLTVQTLFQLQKT